MDAREARALDFIRKGHLYNTRLGFLFVATRLLRYPIPPHLYRRFSGLDFARVADYFDGGYFDVTDDRLAFQFGASRVLATARRRVRLPLVLSLRFIVGSVIRRMWFLLVSRTFAVQVSRLVDQLNRTINPLLAPSKYGERGAYSGAYFSVLHLLWSNRESEAEIESIFGQAALATVRETRAQLVRNVFGREAGSAFRVVDRMFVPNYLYAYEIRKRYDPEYIAALEGSDMRELDFLSLGDNRLENECRGLRALLEQIQAFEGLIRREGISDLAPDRESWRALTVAFLADSKGLRREVDAILSTDDALERTSGLSRLRTTCGSIVEKRRRVTHALRELRIHHLLCREQIVNYRRQLDELLATTRETSPWPTSFSGSSVSSTTSPPSGGRSRVASTP